MTPLKLAKKYMACVFKAVDFDELRSILADDLQFDGPFFNFDTADDYVDSLRSAPPQGFEYEEIRCYEDDSSANLVYLFSKPGISTAMSQTFWTNHGKITRILLIFDTGVFPLA